MRGTGELACTGCSEEHAVKRTKLVISGPPGTQEVLLEPKGVTLGRSSGCDVTLDHFNVSRVHARVFQDPFGRWIVEDLDSRNGVLVGGQRIRAQAVQYGQIVTIHPFDLSVMAETDRAGPRRYRRIST